MVQIVLSVAQSVLTKSSEQPMEHIFKTFESIFCAGMDGWWGEDGNEMGGGFS